MEFHARVELTGRRTDTRPRRNKGPLVIFPLKIYLKNLIQLLNVNVYDNFAFPFVPKFSLLFECIMHMELNVFFRKNRIMTLSEFYFLRNK